MSTIYFSKGVIKPLSETTILNFFSEEESRKTVMVRDTSSEVYVKERTKLTGGVDCYIHDGDYYIDITPYKSLELQAKVYGVFIGEGTSFVIKARDKPIFIVAQKAVSHSSTSDILMQNEEDEELFLGMFLVGSEITYKKKGHEIRERLTFDGWKRVNGPSDEALGIISVSEAYLAAKKEDLELNDSGTSKKREENRYRIKEALASSTGSKPVMESLVRHYDDLDPNSTHFFLKDDIKELRKLKILT